MLAIETKVIPATNTKPVRIKAYTCNGQQLIITYDYNGMQEAHRKAAQALADKCHWGGNLIGGSTSQGYAFVFEDSNFY